MSSQYKTVPGQYLEVELSNLNDLQYLIKLQIGSNAEERTLLADTGSNVLWITSDLCNNQHDSFCDNRHSVPYCIEDSTNGRYYQEVKIGPDGS